MTWCKWQKSKDICSDPPFFRCTTAFSFLCLCSLSVIMFVALLRDVPHAPLVLLPWGRVLVVDYSRMCCSDLVPVVDCAAVLGCVDSVLRKS